MGASLVTLCLGRNLAHSDPPPAPKARLERLFPSGKEREEQCTAKTPRTSRLTLAFWGVYCIALHGIAVPLVTVPRSELQPSSFAMLFTDATEKKVERVMRRCFKRAENRDDKKMTSMIGIFNHAMQCDSTNRKSQ